MTSEKAKPDRHGGDNDGIGISPEAEKSPGKTDQTKTPADSATADVYKKPQSREKLDQYKTESVDMDEAESGVIFKE